MACKVCKSNDVRMLTAEMNIHFPGLENLDTPTVMLFPPVAVCLNCGSAEFVVHGEPLEKLREGTRTPSKNAREVPPER